MGTPCMKQYCLGTPCMEHFISKALLGATVYNWWYFITIQIISISKQLVLYINHMKTIFLMPSFYYITNHTTHDLKQQMDTDNAASDEHFFHGYTCNSLWPLTRSTVTHLTVTMVTRVWWIKADQGDGTQWESYMVCVYIYHLLCELSALLPLVLVLCHVCFYRQCI